MTLDKPTLERILESIRTLHYEAMRSTLSSDDYCAIVALANAVDAPDHVIEHFANLAIEAEATEVYDEYGVNTRNSFNTPPKG